MLLTVSQAKPSPYLIPYFFSPLLSSPILSYPLLSSPLFFSFLPFSSLFFSPLSYIVFPNLVPVRTHSNPHPLGVPTLPVLHGDDPEMLWVWIGRKFEGCSCNHLEESER